MRGLQGRLVGRGWREEREYDVILFNKKSYLKINH